MLEYLKSWYPGEGMNYVAPREFLDLVAAQEKLSGSRLFTGWLVKQWAELQQWYYTITNSRRMGKCWAMAIIT
jgi:hypothetical protein